jgi:hypothetical protein
MDASFEVGTDILSSQIEGVHEVRRDTRSTRLIVIESLNEDDAISLVDL